MATISECRSRWLRVPATTEFLRNPNPRNRRSISPGSGVACPRDAPHAGEVECAPATNTPAAPPDRGSACEGAPSARGSLDQDSRGRSHVVPSPNPLGNRGISLEDQARAHLDTQLKRSCITLSVTTSSANTWDFLAPGKRLVDRLVISSIDNCGYRVLATEDVSALDSSRLIERRYDLTQLQNYTTVKKPEGMYVNVLGTSSLYRYSDRPNDTLSGQIVETWGPFADFGRFERAYTYFRSKFCNGRAF
jgi:hypothetical protein